jgi:hypothetical protein
MHFLDPVCSQQYIFLNLSIASRETLVELGWIVRELRIPTPPFIKGTSPPRVRIKLKLIVILRTPLMRNGNGEVGCESEKKKVKAMNNKTSQSL